MEARTEGLREVSWLSSSTQSNTGVSGVRNS